MLAILLNFAIVLVMQASGQAPGDHAGSCRTGNNAVNHDFPAEFRILVDTWDYENLFSEFGLSSRVWLPVSLDGDNLNYDPFFGGICTASIRACTGQTMQNNWLFSQHIRYVDAREVLFNVSYRFSDCRNPCNKRYVTLYHYNIDSPATPADRMDPQRYDPLLGDEVSSRLEQPSGSNAQTDVTLAITRPANSLGFYLAVRDEGTCGDVSRIIAYYVACPIRVEGLVTYPDTGVAVRSGPDVVFDAQCAANAHNTTTLQVTAFASSSTCSPVAPGGARCECDAGYVVSANGIACERKPHGIMNNDKSRI